MKSDSAMRRALAMLAVVFALSVAPASALAGTHGDLLLAAEEPSTETTTTVPADGPQPAVEAPPVAEPDTSQPWTARFLAPTVLALGVVGLVVAAAYYGIRVRGRYRVIQ